LLWVGGSVEVCGNVLLSVGELAIAGNWVVAKVVVGSASRERWVQRSVEALRVLTPRPVLRGPAELGVMKKKIRQSNSKRLEMGPERRCEYFGFGVRC